MNSIVDGLAFQGRRIDVFSTPDAHEYYDATGTALPASEPATGQVTYTLTAEDFQTVNGSRTGVKNHFYFNIAGKWTGTVAPTIYARILKNGDSVATGSILLSTTYPSFGIAFVGFTDPEVGDLFELRIWGSTEAKYHYSSMIGVIGEYTPTGAPGRLLLELSQEGYATWQPSYGNPYDYSLSPYAVTLRLSDNLLVEPVNTSILDGCTSGTGARGLMATADYPASPAFLAVRRQAGYLPMYKAMKIMATSVTYTPTVIHLEDV